MEVRGRITIFANLTNAVRNANEIGEGVKKNTEEIIGFMQKNGTENMYYNIEQYTREKITSRLKELEGQNSTFIAGYTREERSTEGFGIGEIDY